VSGGIIQAAVTNKNLCLELEYRQVSMLQEGNSGSEEHTTGTGRAYQYDDPQVADEFASLLRVI
jgi:hypothetical protein